MANQLKLDLHDIIAQACGPAGLTEEDFGQIKDLLRKTTVALREDYAKGGLAFLGLPGDTAARDAAKSLAEELRKEFDTLVVLGIGGSSLGAKSVFAALTNPFHNLLPADRRNGMRVFFPDNSDPATFSALLDLLDLKRTAFAAVTKSGGTAETMSQLMVVKQRLQSQLGDDAVKKHIVAVTDPKDGSLRKLANKEGWRTLPVPPAVGGRFSVLTACGTLPAYCAGIDVDALLEGAGAVANRVFNSGHEQLSDTPAGALGALLYWMMTKRDRPIIVFMPYADALRDTGDWVVQLLAESLGKPKGDGFVGPTPVRAVGATDQHSMIQLLMEGPQDKTVVFVGFEKARSDIEIPPSFPDEPNAVYLQGHTMAELLNAERIATTAALSKAGRPSTTILMPDLNAFHMGGLLMTFEIATAAMGHLLGINAFDQPGVELGKRYIGALLKRPGYDDAAKELSSAMNRQRELIIT